MGRSSVQWNVRCPLTGVVSLLCSLGRRWHVSPLLPLGQVYDGSKTDIVDEGNILGLVLGRGRPLDSQAAWRLERWQWPPEGSGALKAVPHLSSPCRPGIDVMLTCCRVEETSKACRRELGERQRVFLQPILFQLPLESFLSGWQLNSYTNINAHVFEISRDFSRFWMLLEFLELLFIFFLFLLDGLQYWFWGEEPAACGGSALSSQAPEYIGLYILSLNFFFFLLKN